MLFLPPQAQRRDTGEDDGSEVPGDSIIGVYLLSSLPWFEERGRSNSQLRELGVQEHAGGFQQSFYSLS